MRALDLIKEYVVRSARPICETAVAVSVVLCFESRAVAQELEVSISPSPVDATAASWNPAGLIQVERPELSVVGSYNGIYETFSARDHNEVDSSHDDHNFDLNYLSFAYPFMIPRVNRNVSIAVNYQRKYDFSRDFDLDYAVSTTTGQGIPFTGYTTMDFDQTGGLSAITPAVAVQVTPTFSVGASVNIWHSSFLSDNTWRQRIRTDGTYEFGPLVQEVTAISTEKYKDFSGENVVAGVLWNVTPKWSLAARYDSGFTGDARYRRVDTRIQDGTTMPTVTTRESRDVRFPSSVAVGTAYHPNDRLTLSFDITRTDNWKDFFYETADGQRFSLIDAGPINDPDTKRTTFDPTHTVRFGAEYVFLDDQIDYLWTLRGGLFYDQEPASGHPDNFYGFAIGGGLVAHQRVSIDLAYQLRYGTDVNEDFIRGIQGFNEDVIQHRMLISAIVYF